MIIHHQDGSKAIIEKAIKTVRTKQNRIVMCFKSPGTSAKGIVEFQPHEVLQFLEATKSPTSIDDRVLFGQFAGIKPYEGKDV